MGRRKKKSIRQEYTEGLRHLAFGEIQDAVRLLYAPEEQILPALGEMDLFNIICALRRASWPPASWS